MTLYEKLNSMVDDLRAEKKDILTNQGDVVISQCTVKQAFGGMRGVKGMICDTSVVEPDTGLIIRGYPLGEVDQKWPEDIFYLLCTGELPGDDEVKAIRKDFADRCEMPSYVVDVLKAMPKDSHPMAMLDAGILVMQRESKFYEKYQAGMHKTEYWEPMLEDSLRLLAVLPSIAAAVYRIRFNKGDLIAADNSLDWGANYAHMLGLDDPDGKLADLCRLYLTLHCDHEGGNVSANTCHTVGSALSDAFYAVSAGLNGLAGPLHGLANQECLKFVLEINEKFGGTPTKEQLSEYAWGNLNSGKVIPGYGHAVLRVTDPRFTAFLAFGKANMPEDPVYKTVQLMYDTVPGILKEHGKAANPWPNVDAGSGALLHHFGLTEFSYYTVLFSVSRAMGMCSQLIINRLLGTAITRPKSVSSKWVKDNAK